jgi:GT2 family glycosyltransferase
MGKVVVVLGMHRSGTSALTRGLQALAIDLGPNLKPAVPDHNGTGFFEDAGLSAINEELLALAGCSWDTLHVSPLRPADEPRIRELKSRASQLLRAQFGHSACFGFKDPRTCRTLPFWQEVIAELGLEPFYVLCIRNPLSTAQSLARGHNFPRRKSYWLWLLHMLEAVRLTSGARRVFIEFESLLAEPERAIGRIEALVDDEQVRVSAAAMKSYVGFLQPSLVHYHASGQELSSDPRCPELVHDVYALLRDHAGRSKDCSGSEARWTDCIRIFRSMAWLAGLEDRADRDARTGTDRHRTDGAHQLGQATADHLPTAGVAADGTKRMVFFTICSMNYLALARTLFGSLRMHYPDAVMFLALADEPGGELDPAGQPFGLIRLDDLDIADWREMALRYGIMEFNTAIKPYVFRYLFEHVGAACAVYLDPDIYVKGAMPELESALAAGADAVLTPHLLAPAEHAEISDIKMLQFGTFNLGFLALRNSPQVRKIIDWWARRTARDCLARLDQGLYLDQKWADLFPVYLPGTHILRHPGYNVAYWNLSQRTVHLEHGQWLVNGHPLRFVHFAGQAIEDPTVFSRHSSEFNPTNIGDLKLLLDEYRAECLRNGHALYAGTPNPILGGVPEETKGPSDAGAATDRAPVKSGWRPADWSRSNLWTYQQYPPRILTPPRRRGSLWPVRGAPHFAIVTPTLNRSRFLRATIDSVLGQDYAGLSYAVQDCVSDDGTAELLADYGDRVSWRSEPDAGQADAVNRAFSRIAGDVMACISSDDVYLPDTLHIVARFFARNPEIDVIYGHRIYIDARGWEIGRGIFPPHDDVALKWADFLPHDAVFWRRRVWDAVGPFDPAFDCMFAWDFLLRAQARGFRFHRVPAFLTCYRIHDRQKSSVEKAMYEREAEALRTRAIDADPAGPHVLYKAYEAYLRRQARFDLLYRLGIVRPG